MTILNILKNPDPLLKQKSDNITLFDQNLKQLIADMFETTQFYNGVGLAAPQCGILQRLIVINYKKKKLALINPVIVDSSGEKIEAESCLSCPNDSSYVSRAEKITLKALSPNGKQITIREEGFIARIIQHEIDHLNGILIVDKGNPVDNLPDIDPRIFT